MSQPQDQQVIYLVMDENNQGQQIQFIDGQPTLVMAPEQAGLLGGMGSGLTGTDDSQVLLVSEDGQLVTGNEGQVVVDEQGQVVMTTDEGQQVALETETVNMSSSQQIQYVLSSESLTSHSTSKTNILSQAGSIITGGQARNKETNGTTTKDEDGYTTIVIGDGNQASGEPAADAYRNVYLDSKSDVTTVVNSLGQPRIVTHQSHPILSSQLNISQSPVKSPIRSTVESPRTKMPMVSILDKARLASLQQQQSASQAAAVSTQPQITQAVAEDAVIQEELPPETEPESMEVDKVGEEPQEQTETDEQETNGQVADYENQNQSQMIHIENIPLPTPEPAPADQSSSLPADVMSESTATDVEPEKARILPEQIQGEHSAAGTDSSENLAPTSVKPAPIGLCSPVRNTEVTTLTSSLEEYMTRRPVLSTPQIELAQAPVSEIAPKSTSMSETPEPTQISELNPEPTSVSELGSDPVPMSEVAPEPASMSDLAPEPTPMPELAPEPTSMPDLSPGHIHMSELAPETAQISEVASEPTLVSEVAPGSAQMSVLASEPTPMYEADAEPVPMSDHEDESPPMGHVGMGTLLGPFREDSDDSGAELDDHPLTIDTSAQTGKAPKPMSKRQKVDRSSVDDKGGSESDSNRRRSSRVKSPKRYSEEPIIFGEDFNKPPEPKPQTPRDDSPKKKGRPPKKRPYYVYEEIDTSESEGVTQSEGEEAVKPVVEKTKIKSPPKKRISTAASSAESSEEMPRVAVPEDSPKRRGRPPKKRFLEQHNSSQEEDNVEKAKKEEETRMRKKSIEKKTPSIVKTWSFRTRPAPEEKALESEPEELSEEPETLSKVAEKKRTVEDITIEDNFGFDEESEKEEDLKKLEVIPKPAEMILMRKTDTPIIVQKDIASPPKVPASVTQVILSPETAAQVKVTVSPAKHKPTEPKEDENRVEETKTPVKGLDKSFMPNSETKTKPKYSQDNSKPSMDAAVKSMGTTTSSNRKLSMNFKSMKFSVSKRLSAGTTPEKKIFTSRVSKISPTAGLTKTPPQSGAAVKDLQSRELACTKREQKVRALDTELEVRAAQLTVKESRLDRLERKLKETEKNLDYRERRIKREEQNMEGEKESSTKGRKSLGSASELGDKEKTLKNLEKKLAVKEQDLIKKEEQMKLETIDLEKKKGLLATTEQQLTALSQELSEKYAYLQDQEDTVSKEDRPGLFEKIASLGKATELTLLRDPKEKGKRKREEEAEEAKPSKKSEEGETEVTEPAKKKSRRSSATEKLPTKAATVKKGSKLSQFLSKRKKYNVQQEKKTVASDKPEKTVKKQHSMLARLALHGKPGIKTRVPRLPDEPGKETKTRAQTLTPKAKASSPTAKASISKAKASTPKVQGTTVKASTPKALKTKASMPKSQALTPKATAASPNSKGKKVSTSSLRGKSASRLPRASSTSSVKKDTPKGKGHTLPPSKGSKSSIRSTKATPKGRKK